MTDKYNYYPERKEVIITGCRDCPFSKYDVIASMKQESYTCELIGTLVVASDFSVNDYFPSYCPLRESNFKFTRDLG